MTDEATQGRISALTQQQREEQMLRDPEAFRAAQEPAAFIWADYKEYRPETFKGFMVDIEEKAHGPFISYEDELRFAHANCDRVFNTSSIDHYKQDLARGMTH